MDSPVTDAVVICPAGDNPWIGGRRLLGLTVGERLLLSLRAAGIERVTFVGDGPRPRSDRAELTEATGAPAADTSFILLAADTVLDRQLLGDGELPLDGRPLLRLPAAEWAGIVEAGESGLARLGGSDAPQGRGFAVRVTDRHSAAAARRALLDSLRKPTDGIVSRNLNRHISLFLTRYLVQTGIRPNQLTVFIMLMGIFSAICAAFPEHWWALVLAGICFQGQSVCDGCDGEIARLTHRYSFVGQWLDTLGDDLTNNLFFLGLAVGQARALGLPWIYAAGGVTFAFLWATSLVMYARIIKMGTGDLLAIPNTVTPGAGQKAGAGGEILRFLRMISKRDFFALLLAVLTAAGQPLLALILMGAGTYPAFILVTANELRLRKAEREGQSTRPE